MIITLGAFLPTVRKVPTSLASRDQRSIRQLSNDKYWRKSGARLVRRLLLFGALFTGVCLAAEASESEQGNGAPVNPSDWTIQIGVLSAYWPEFEGSDEFEPEAMPYLSFEYQDRYFIHFTDGIGVNFRKDDNVRLAASIAYAGGRDESDADELQGVGDINGGATLNLFSEYQLGKVSFDGKLVHQFSGDNTGFLVDAGVGYTFIIANTALVKPALIASFASSRYTHTYFGINVAQAQSSGLDTHDAGAGLKNVGLQVDLLRPFANHWNVLGQFKYERLLGDTADSPIVLDVNQYSVGLGIAYQF